ncbi:MAG: PD40 domain-containing protein [Burkholderiales bacterium]|nr:PD40 domain-containing protein [Burkholderiales bacterium]
MSSPVRALLALGLLAVINASAASGEVLFVSNRDGNSQIYIMNADGADQRALTQGPAENTEPAWSPDGRRIAFTSYRDGDGEIYVMGADGSTPRRLTFDRGADNSPVWTPDGRIVFRSNRSRWSNFYVMDADGGNLRQLSGSEHDKGTPVLSPDGRWIAYIGFGDLGRTDVFVMPIAGGAATSVTAKLTTRQVLSPLWSPDSKRLIYLESSGVTLNIHSVAFDGSEPKKLTDNVYSNASPVWSPDGKRIAFVSSREADTRAERARGDIYVMNADGSESINLTRNAHEDNYPAWSADGRTIYFVSLRDGTAQIYAVAAEPAASDRRLTRNSGHDLMIRPVPARPASMQKASAARPQPFTH